VAASTNVHAGHKISITHNIFRGITAAIAPNRKLCVSPESAVKNNRLEKRAQSENFETFLSNFEKNSIFAVRIRNSK
jgi:hypothetical protein